MSNPDLSVLHIGHLPVLAPLGGGLSAVCQPLMTGLTARGFDVRTLSPTTVDDPGFERFAVQFPDIAVHPYVMPHTAHDQTSYEQLITQRLHITAVLPRLLAERRTDVVLIGHAAYVLGIPEIARAYGAASIVWTHSPMVAAVAEVQRYPPELLPRILQQMTQADAVVAAARHMARDLRKLDFDNVTTIANGIDLTRFRPMAANAAVKNSLNLDCDAVVVMHLSNLKPPKRGMHLIRSAAQALKRHDRLVYVIMGDGPGRRDMMAACETCGIADRVRFTGWIDAAAVPDYLSIADIVVMPSVTEGLSLAYLEAQACGGTLLAGDIPAAREVVRDGETGMLFPVDDIDALTERTLTLAADPVLRQRIGQRARDWVAGHHDIADMVDAWAARIERVAGEHRRQSMRGP